MAFLLLEVLTNTQDLNVNSYYKGETFGYRAEEEMSGTTQSGTMIGAFCKYKEFW